LGEPGGRQRLLAHLLEAETGFRSGDPFRAGPGEPRPEYDPGLVPLVTDRRLAKVAELAALREREPEHAGLLGLGQVSLRTLERWAARYYRWGVMGCADDRWLRTCTGHRIAEPVREAIYAARLRSWRSCRCPPRPRCCTSRSRRAVSTARTPTARC